MTVTLAAAPARLALVVVGALLVSLLPATVGGADGSAVRLEGPQHVAAGRPFELVLVASDVRDVAGYQAELRFDRRDVRFGGASHRDSDLRASGRDVVELGPSDQRWGVVVGAWSCPVRDCLSRRGERSNGGSSGRVILARLGFSSVRGGSPRISLGRVLLVDRLGQPIPTAGTVVGRVRPGGRAVDITNDGLVTHADAAEAAIAWQRARRGGDGCDTRGIANADVDGDGCLDVSDVMGIAGRLSPAGARRDVDDARTSEASIAGGGPITVDTTGDAPDASPGDGICATSAGACSLRAAITEANLAAGPDTIAFAIPGAGVQTIALGSALPTLNDETGPTTIDGYTQPGAAPNTDPIASNAVLTVELVGTTSVDALTITSAGNTIRGLSIHHFRHHIWLSGPGARDNSIVGAFIGQDPAGTHNPTVFVDGAYGVALTAGARRNHIGEPNAADRNVISGNSHSGIWLWGEGTDNNVIKNNITGLSPSGDAQRRNIGRGIDINAISSNNVVGGTGPMERNVSSGNSSEGIEISHNTMTVNNRIIGNLVGTTLDGGSAPAYALNFWSGVHLEDGVTSNVVADNVVGNSGCGNTGGGVVIENYAAGTIVRDNRIGISEGGINIANCNWGVIVRTSAGRTRIVDNVIAYQPIGVLIGGTTSDENLISRNVITDHAQLAIDLATPNGPGVDPATSGNDGQAAPVIVSATPAEVTGTSCTGCRVELFAAQGSGTSAGATAFLGWGFADAYGTFSVPIGSPGLAPGSRVAATATDTESDTSELSLPMSVADQPYPAADPQVFASDAFGRVRTAGWGSADVGGPYTHNAAAANYEVDGTAGLMRVPAAGNSRSALLNGVTGRDMDISMRVRVDKDIAGAASFVYLVARRGGSDEYRAKLRLTPNGTMTLRASRVLNNQEVDLGTNGPAVAVPSGWIRIRAQFVGADPTFIRIKAWKDGDPEPRGWQWTISDSTAALQDAGTMGVRAYISGGTSNPPLTFSVDDLLATAPRPPLSADPEPPAPTEIALDAFGGSTTRGWGVADVGGHWAVHLVPQDYSVGGGESRMVMPTGAANRAAILSSVSVTDVELSYRIRTDKAPVGGNAFTYGLVRRVSGGTEYRAKVRLAANGRVFVQASRAVDNVETSLGAEVRVVDITHAAGQWINVRVLVTGTSPTSISIRAWADGQPEPSAWHYSTTDTLAALQEPGAIGLRAYLSTAVSNAPIVVSFDDFRAVAP